MLWRPNGRELHSTPLKWSNDQLEYHGVLLSLLFPVCEESPQLGVSHPYNKDQSESTRVREGSNTHKSAAIRTHTAKTWAQMNNTKFTTRMELKSLRKSIECVETECEWLRMLKVCLVFSSMRLGVPFIAPRQLGAVEGILGRQFLPSIGCPVRDRLPFLENPTVAVLRLLAHRTVRSPCWPLARPRVTRGLRGRPLAQSTVGSPDSPVHHRTIRWFLAVRRWSFPESDDFAADDAPETPVHHRTVWWFIAIRRRRVPRVDCSPRLVLAHRTLSGAPPDSLVHPDQSCIWLYTTNPFPNRFLLFLALRHNTLVFKTMY
jgi:hypothetical protein